MESMTGNDGKRRGPSSLFLGEEMVVIAVRIIKGLMMPRN